MFCLALQLGRQNNCITTFLEAVTGQSESQGTEGATYIFYVSCSGGRFSTTTPSGRWQEYTEELYKKDLHGPDNHDGVITNLEPDILECEVKWALESITTNKASGGDGIPVELFQILKDDAVKVLHLICQQI